MVLNIKNLFKKVCMLSAAATMAVGLGASFAEAAPGANDTGFKIESVSIAAASITKTDTNKPYVTLSWISNLSYDGSSKQLIESVSTNFTDGTLYLRIADTEGAAPTNANDWVKYDITDSTSITSSLSNEKLKRVNAGTYYAYGYIETDENHSSPTSNQ